LHHRRPLDCRAARGSRSPRMALKSGSVPKGAAQRRSRLGPMAPAPRDGCCRCLFDALLGLGTWVAVATCPRTPLFARVSDAMWAPASLREVWRQFLCVTRMYLLRLAARRGRPPSASDAQLRRFFYLHDTDRPALLGTFHLGNSTS